MNDNQLNDEAKLIDRIESLENTVAMMSVAKEIPQKTVVNYDPIIPSAEELSRYNPVVVEEEITPVLPQVEEPVSVVKSDEITIPNLCTNCIEIIVHFV